MENYLNLCKIKLTTSESILFYFITNNVLANFIERIYSYKIYLILKIYKCLIFITVDFSMCFKDILVKNYPNKISFLCMCIYIYITLAFIYIIYSITNKLL